MASLAPLTRKAVEAAINEFDAQGREAFLATYGFGKSRAFWLLHNGERYDSKAIVGVAFKYLARNGAPLRANDFGGGEKTVKKRLQELRFEVEVDGVRSGGPLTNRKAIEANAASDEPFDPTNAKDARKEVLRAIKARRGQRKFRDALIEAYRGACAITGCTVLDVLEAAHITPYLGPQTNHVTNGLLLRADLHTLFDTGAIAIDPSTRKVLVAPNIADPVYQALHGQPLRPTTKTSHGPSKAALKQHRSDCGW